MIFSLGYLDHKLTGKSAKEVIHKSAIAENRVQIQNLIFEGEVVFETVWETKNRKAVEGELKLKAIYNSEGVFIGSRGVFRDISERKKIEMSQRLLRLGKLAADVAHEINNPVTIVTGRAHLSLMSEIQDENLK